MIPGYTYYYVLQWQLNIPGISCYRRGDGLERCGRVRRLGLRDYQKGLRHAGKQHAR